MIETLRKALKSWVATALILLLIASFAVWGIGDVFSGRSGSIVAEVGETELAADEFARELDRQRVRYSQQAQRVVTIDELRSYGVDRQVLDRLIRDKAIAEELRLLGISAPDEAVAADVRRLFEETGGTFDASEYREQLRRAGYTVPEFEATARAGLAQRVLTSALAPAPGPVPGVAEAIARRQGETRIVRLIRLDADDVEAPGAPGEDEIAAFFDAHRSDYSEPERRSGEFVLVDIAPMIPDHMPPEDEVRARYDELGAMVSRPATRDIDQIEFADRAAAEDAAARLAAGEASFEDLIAEQGMVPAQAALGPVTPTSVEAAIAEAVFAVDAPGIVGPVETRFGVSVIRVNAVTEGMTIPFEVLRDQIALEMAREAAAEVARDRAVEVEDLRAASTPFAAIAEQVGVSAGTFSEMARDATVPGGAVADGVPADPEFLAEVFSAETGADRDLVELTDGSYVLVRVDEVAPERPLTLDEARERVIEDWRAAEIARRLAELGERLAGFADGPSGDLRAVAAGRLTPVETVGPFGRAEPPAGLPDDLAASLFEIAEGDATSGPAADGAGVIVAELAEIIPIPEDLLADVEAELAERLRESLSRDALEYFGRSLEARFEASIYPATIEGVYNTLNAR